MKILELGCGERKYIGAVGLDNQKRFNPDILWDLNKFPYPIKSGSYDLILCREVIEHLKCPEKVISEITRILSNNGILLLTTNNKNSLINRLFKTYHIEHHVSLQTIDSLKKIISKELTILKFFYLPYDDMQRDDLKYRILRPFRRILHLMLPKKLKERIVVIATKRRK